MLKKIKIFLASSIDDLKLDRTEIGDFFRQLNEIYIERELYFKLIKCEDYDNSIADSGKQTEYDAEIRDSELVFFLFFTKVGEYTRHEFDVALDSYRKAGQPKIVTYIKYVSDADEVNEEVKAFMQMLDGELMHYYNTYSSIDTLKLGILMQIKLMQMDAAEIEVEEGKICLDGQAVAKCGEIPLFSGNPTIQKLNAKIKELDEEYYSLREKYTNNPNDMEVYERYSYIASEKSKLEEQLKEQEKQALGLAEQIADASSKKLSKKQKEGYRLLEMGDYAGALEVLNLDGIRNDIRHNETLSEGVNERLQINVNELLQRIKVLKTQGKNKQSIPEIKSIYDEACGLVRKHNLEKDSLYDYANFLYNQNEHKEAVKIAEQLSFYYSEFDENVPDEKMARLYNLLGRIYKITQRFDDAEKFHKKAVAIRERLCKKNSEANENDLATSYTNLGGLFRDTQRFREAEELYKKAIEISERLCKLNPKLYENDLAITYNELGVSYKREHRFIEAEEYYKKSLEIRERLCKRNPKAYENTVATSYNNLGLLYDDIKRYEEAEAYYKKATEIRERLCKRNPQAYEPDLATSYNNLGLLYDNIKRYEEAEAYYKKATEIRERLCKRNPQVYEPNLSNSYNNLGLLYKTTKRYEESKECYKKSIEIRVRLCKRNPQAYEPDLASSYNNLGLLYKTTERYAKAEEYNKKATEICERLCKKNPQVYESNLATSYNNLGSLYKTTKRYEEAEEYYKKAIEIRERLYERNPQAYESGLATSYNNLGYLYKQIDKQAEARKYFIKAKELYERLNARTNNIYTEDIDRINRLLNTNNNTNNNTDNTNKKKFRFPFGRK